MEKGAAKWWSLSRYLTVLISQIIVKLTCLFLTTRGLTSAWGRSPETCQNATKQIGSMSVDDDWREVSNAGMVIKLLLSIIQPTNYIAPQAVSPQGHSVNESHYGRFITTDEDLHQ